MAGESLMRPQSVQSRTWRYRTGCGNLYVTIGEVEGRPIEVFIHLGHSGGCGAAHQEGLARAVSLALRHGATDAEIIHQLEGIECPNSMIDEGIKITSCCDAVATAFRMRAKV